LLRAYFARKNRSNILGAIVAKKKSPKKAPGDDFVVNNLDPMALEQLDGALPGADFINQF
jgi:hypothetical protein